MSVSSAFDTQPWHVRPDLLARWLHDFIVGQMRQLRPGYASPEAGFAGQLLNRDAADIDSIELAELGGALYAALDAQSSGALDDSRTASPKLGRSFASWLAFCAHAAGLTQTLSFFTSGSTGAARCVEHRVEHLTREIEEFLNVLCAGEFRPARIVTVMPTQHLYGFLFGILLPARLGLALHRCDSQVPAAVCAQLQAGDVLLAHPTFWQAALTQAPSVRFPSPSLGISSGQAMPEALFALAIEASIRLIDIYGSTETAGVGWRDRAGPLTLMARYQLDAEGALRDSYDSSVLKIAPDQLQREADGRVTVLARLDRVVQVHGVNVQLARVESCIATALGRLASVRLSAKTGRLSAFLVGEAIAESTLRAALKPHLSDAELPTRWQFGAQLPKTSSGKPAAFD